MVTSKWALALLGLVGLVIGVATIVAVGLVPSSFYAARRAQIFDEPARLYFVTGAVALAVIPVLGLVACVAFRLAHASTPVRRGLTAWGCSILAAGLALVVYLPLAFVLPTPGAISTFNIAVAVYAVASAVIWVAVARRKRFDKRQPPTYRRLEDI